MPLYLPSGRELLLAARTYYVLTTGSDTNSGLANTAGGAFLTIQKAIDTVAMLDTSIYNVTIQIGAGTYTGTNALKTIVGAGTVTILGDAATPANVVISTTSADCFSATNIVGKWVLNGIKLTAATAGYLLNLSGPTVTVSFLNINFGASAAIQIYADSGAVVTATGNYTVSGGSGFHLYIAAGKSYASTITITVSGTPAFVTFALGDALGYIQFYTVTFSGAATGQRFSSNANSVINTFAGGATFIPGNTAGVATNGGLYL